MQLLQGSHTFNWKEFLLGNEEWEFMPEVVLRTSVMFIVIVIGLRVLGKRGVKQLSVFELVVIIGLGSAAGDPMFYRDVGIIPALVVFFMVIVLYSSITYLIGKSERFESMVEGKAVQLIKGGVFTIDNFKKEALGEDEFFAELRQQSISQLGQVEEAIIESSGSISIFYYPDDEVKYGLPIMPGTIASSHKEISESGHYSCIFCGYTAILQPVPEQICPVCKKWKWVKSSNRIRIR